MQKKIMIAGVECHIHPNNECWNLEASDWLDSSLDFRVQLAIPWILHTTLATSTPCPRLNIIITTTTTSLYSIVSHRANRSIVWLARAGVVLHSNGLTVSRIQMS